MRVVFKILLSVFILVFVVLVSFMFYIPDSMKNIKYSADISNYVGEQMLLSGKFSTQTIECVKDKECTYVIVFIDESSVFSNISVSKKSVPVTCFDEYSKDPRKYIQLVCGIRYIDAEIQKEKFEQLNLDFSNSEIYNFTFTRKNSKYYLDIN